MVLLMKIIFAGKGAGFKKRFGNLGFEEHGSPTGDSMIWVQLRELLEINVGFHASLTFGEISRTVTVIWGRL